MAQFSSSTEFDGVINGVVPMPLNLKNLSGADQNLNWTWYKRAQYWDQSENRYTDKEKLTALEQCFVQNSQAAIWWTNRKTSYNSWSGMLADFKARFCKPVAARPGKRPWRLLRQIGGASQTRKPSKLTSDDAQKPYHDTPQINDSNKQDTETQNARFTKPDQTPESGEKPFYETSPMLLVNIGNTEVHALLDTGATTSIISKQLVQQLGLIPKNGDSINMYSCDGSRVACEGIVHVDFRIKEHEFCHKFIVMTNASQQLIIGIDIMKEHGFHLLCDEAVMYLRKAPLKPIEFLPADYYYMRSVSSYAKYNHHKHEIFVYDKYEKQASETHATNEAPINSPAEPDTLKHFPIRHSTIIENNHSEAIYSHNAKAYLQEVNDIVNSPQIFDKFFSCSLINPELVRKAAPYFGDELVNLIVQTGFKDVLTPVDSSCEFDNNSGTSLNSELEYRQIVTNHNLSELEYRQIVTNHNLSELEYRQIVTNHNLSELEYRQIVTNHNLTALRIQI